MGDPLRGTLVAIHSHVFGSADASDAQGGPQCMKRVVSSTMCPCGPCDVGHRFPLGRLSARCFSSEWLFYCVVNRASVTLRKLSATMCPYAVLSCGTMDFYPIFSRPIKEDESKQRRTFRFQKEEQYWSVRRFTWV